MTKDDRNDTHRPRRPARCWLQATRVQQTAHRNRVEYPWIRGSQTAMTAQEELIQHTAEISLKKRDSFRRFFDRNLHEPEPISLHSKLLIIEYGRADVKIRKIWGGVECTSNSRHVPHRHHSLNQSQIRNMHRLRQLCLLFLSRMQVIETRHPVHAIHIWVEGAWQLVRVSRGFGCHITK